MMNIYSVKWAPVPSSSDADPPDIFNLDVLFYFGNVNIYLHFISHPA